MEHEEPFPNQEYDSRNYLRHLDDIADEDAATLFDAEKSYGDSWKKRGGTGAFMMLARKWDRIEKQVSATAFNVFRAIEVDERKEGVIDDIRDLRRYLMLVEAECRERGYPATTNEEKPETVLSVCDGCNRPLTSGQAVARPSGTANWMHAKCVTPPDPSTIPTTPAP